jgi:hypothetical protein
MLDFIGIGARRAGEDWLFGHLRRHPEIHFPREMELGFWSQHYPRSLIQPDYSRNLDWYRSVFAHWEDGISPAVRQHERPQNPQQAAHQRTWFDKVMAALDHLDTRSHGARLAALDQPAPDPQAEVVQAASKLGDYSPTYCWFDDPSTLQAIHSFCPQARILYLIRDPHARAWAAAEKLRELAGLSPHEVSDAWYIDHFHSSMSQKHGDYARAVSQWQPHFGEALLILQYEHIAQDPHALLRAACTHIGVADTAYFDAEPAPALLASLPPQTPIRESLRPMLQHLYAEKNHALNQQTGICY